MPKLPLKYYKDKDVVFLAKDLLGSILYTKIDGKVTAGIISETEAYAGVEDKASHAYGGRRTNRNEVMYASGGVSYVYLCYGIHYLFNIVTNEANTPHAILIRSIYPVKGLATILERRNAKNFNEKLTVGPGKVSQALGISIKQNGFKLNSDTVWLEAPRQTIDPKQIQIGPRIGVDYAKEDALLPYRFWIPQQYFKLQ